MEIGRSGRGGVRVGIDRSGEGKGGRVGIDTDEWDGRGRELV